MRYFIVIIVFLCYGCGCFEVQLEDKGGYPELSKKITIVNHTNEIYKNNTLLSLAPKFYKEQGTWKLGYCSSDDYLHVQKINTIVQNGTINKNEKGKTLELNESYTADYEKLFLFSFGGRKIFFGAYEAPYSMVWGETKSDCTSDFIRYDIHPVWQEKELTIEIYEDKIKFSDPKIKETKKLRLSYDEYVDPNTLPLVDCSKE